MISLYHVFADGYDHYTSCFVEAVTVTNRLVDQGRENVRLNREDYADADAVEADLYDETILIAKGDFPL